MLQQWLSTEHNKSAVFHQSPLRIGDLRYVPRKILLQSVLHWDQIRSGKASELAFREEYEKLLLFSLLTPWKPAQWLDQAQILYRNFGRTTSSKLNYSQHIFYFSTDVSNIIKSQDEDGHRTVQLDYQEAVVFFGFYKKQIGFQITATALEENSVILNTANLTGGYFQINQKWVLSDSRNGEEDGTFLEDHFTFTTPRILSRLAKPQARAAHTGLLENIWRYFKDIKET